MQFNLINYPKFNESTTRKQKKNNTELINNKNQEKVALQLPEIINELNNNTLFNIESKEEIPIIFENFTWFNKIQTNVKNIIKKIQGHEVLEHSIAHYKPNTKTIHIFNGIFNPTINNEKFQTSYAKLIDSVN